MVQSPAADTTQSTSLPPLFGAASPAPDPKSVPSNESSEPVRDEEKHFETPPTQGRKAAHMKKGRSDTRLQQRSSEPAQAGTQTTGRRGPDKQRLPRVNSLAGIDRFAMVNDQVPWT